MKTLIKSAAILLIFASSALALEHKFFISRSGPTKAEARAKVDEFIYRTYPKARIVCVTFRGGVVKNNIFY
jgi:hypothetical protein